MLSNLKNRDTSMILNTHGRKEAGTQLKMLKFLMEIFMSPTQKKLKKIVGILACFMEK